MSLRVQIISKDNGVGLSRDVTILRDAIERARPGCEVVFTDWRDRGKRTKPREYDLNVFLELVNPQFFGDARKNVLVPNPEWYIREWTPHLRRFDEVWAKTRSAEVSFSPYNRSTVFVGWDSVDQWDPAVPKKRQMLHVAGKSSAKGTEQVLEAYRALQTDVPLVVVGDREVPKMIGLSHYRRVDDARLKQLMNESPLHLCPSSYEGFGHYINEARSVGAFVITTNAAPMNELVTHHFGMGAAVGSTSVQNLGLHSHVDTESLARCIGYASNAWSTVVNIGRRSRSFFLAGRTDFRTNLNNLLPR